MPWPALWHLDYRGPRAPPALAKRRLSMRSIKSPGINVNALASAIVRRLNLSKRSPSRIDAVASAVARRLQTKRSRAGRLPINALASAIAKRLSIGHRASNVDVLASAVAQRLSKAA